MRCPRSRKESLMSWKPIGSIVAEQSAAAQLARIMKGKPKPSQPPPKPSKWRLRLRQIYVRKEDDKVFCWWRCHHRRLAHCSSPEPWARWATAEDACMCWFVSHPWHSQRTGCALGSSKGESGIQSNARWIPQPTSRAGKLVSRDQKSLCQHPLDNRELATDKRSRQGCSSWAPTDLEVGRFPSSIQRLSYPKTISTLRGI